MYSYKGLLSQLTKALSLKEIAREAPFPSTETQGLPSSCVIPACDVGTPSNLIGPDSGPLVNRRDMSPSPPYLSLLPILPDTVIFAGKLKLFFKKRKKNENQ